MIHTTQTWKIVDAIKGMGDVDDNFVDLVTTDPPYGYSFMGTDWDKAVPSVDIWQECLRILKPGAFAFIMSAPRQDVLAHNLVNLSDAGFETGFTSIYWAYASGFPKAGNIGKMVDKRGGVSVSWFGKWLKEWRIKNNIPQKEIAKLFPSKTGGLTGCVANWELGLNIPTPAQFTKICKYFNLPFESIEEAEREVVKERVKNVAWDNTSYNIGSNGEDRRDITIPATPQAKELDGSYGGFQPKPAVEVIMVVMKPLSEKTYVDQALANGKGITWLDDGRIPIAADDRHEYGVDGDEGDPCVNTHGERNRVAYQQNARGRFPANLLVSDDVLNDGNNTIGSDAIRHNNQHITSGHGIYGKYNQTDTIGYADSGSFSRYFDLDAWWGARIKQLPEEARKTFPVLITPKASKSEKGDNNKHPTVKPVKLFSWLITIGSREGDLVLDPFLGSGTALEAGRFTNRSVVGFDISDEHEHLYPNRCLTHTPPLTAYFEDSVL